MIRVALTDQDRALLNKPASGAGGFQGLLRRLNECRRGAFLELGRTTAERVARYADGYGSGGFQGRIRELAQRVKRELATRPEPSAKELQGGLGL